MSGWVQVGMNVGGDRQAVRAFETFGMDVSDMSEPLMTAGERLVDAIEQQLDTEGTIGLGHRWRRLSRAYDDWKTVHFPGRRILERTGLMRRELLDKGRALFLLGPQRVLYAPASDVAGWHQTGTSRMPDRKIVALNNAQRHWIVDQTFAAWLHRLRIRHGFAA